ncbi:hypothetical protein RvY_04992 [Ramazzottius varieornatus]|uniref:dolichol kinase n=1 Tax=Ramazzottius varieornatus TaxID=947166 RepID=A0A1D1UTL3_RAMVA|nr:hypothetical protein RvY_04992 [Ramazzottius varieornatus]
MDAVSFVSGCFTNPVRRQLIGWWSLLVVTSVTWCYISPFLGLPTTVKRKLFHLAISAVYISGIYYDAFFLCIAAAVVFLAFIIVEIARLYGPPFISAILNDAIQTFLDETADGRIVFSHFSLLLGVSMPVWVDYTLRNDGSHSIISYAGVITIGIGDSFAAIVGKAVGRHRWPGQSRTLEGSFAMLASQLIACECLSYLDSSVFTPSSSSFSLIYLRLLWLVHACCVSLAEAFLNMDNILIPVISVVLLHLLYPHTAFPIDLFNVKNTIL